MLTAASGDARLERGHDQRPFRWIADDLPRVGFIAALADRRIVAVCSRGQRLDEIDLFERIDRFVAGVVRLR